VGTKISGVQPKTARVAAMLAVAGAMAMCCVAIATEQLANS
jgi:hypothetical protein